MWFLVLSWLFPNIKTVLFFLLLFFNNGSQLSFSLRSQNLLLWTCLKGKSALLRCSPSPQVTEFFFACAKRYSRWVALKSPSVILFSPDAIFAKIGKCWIKLIIVFSFAFNLCWIVVVLCTHTSVFLSVFTFIFFHSSL